MRYLPNGEQMKAADAYTIGELGVPSLVLMERAARACVSYMEEQEFDLSNICVVCGSGNNGGDGFAIARMFAQKGLKVTVVMAGNPDHCTEETRHQIELLKKTDARYSSEFAEDEYSIIIDAVFGVGLCREISGHYYEVIRRVNEMDAVKVAVDIPSGISAATGNVLGIAFQADHTVTIQETKLGLMLYPGKEYAGKISVAEIGIDREPLVKDLSVAYTLEKEEYRLLLPVRQADSNKGSFGKVLVIAGCKGMSGAAYLNALAAYRSGAGLVQIYTPEENRIVLQCQLPEAILSTYREYDEDELLRLLSWADTVCIGSGLGMSETSEMILETVIRHVRVPCVVDADGLNLLARSKECVEKLCNRRFVLTPHMKEFERLSGNLVADTKADRMSVLGEFVDRYGITCVLKDARTVVWTKNSRPFVNLSGCSAMAKAGSGDVLAGVIAALLAQRLSCDAAAVLGVYFHGLAGEHVQEEKGVYSLLARELADAVGLKMGRFLDNEKL